MIILGSDGFVALLTKNYINNEKKYDECKKAEKENIPMYAIINDKSMPLGKFKELPWRHVYYINEENIDNILLEIKRDLQWIKGSGGP